MFGLINFLIFVGLLIYYFARPAKNFWLHREVTIRERMAAARHAYESVKAEHDNLAKRDKEIDAELGAMRIEIIKEGELERQEIVKAARSYAKRLHDDAKRIVEQGTEDALLAVKEAISAAVINIVKRRILTEVNVDKHVKMVKFAKSEIERAIH